MAHASVGFASCLLHQSSHGMSCIGHHQRDVRLGRHFVIGQIQWDFTGTVRFLFGLLQKEACKRP
jgi:hypothetical protein